MAGKKAFKDIDWTGSAGQMLFFSCFIIRLQGINMALWYF